MTRRLNPLLIVFAAFTYVFLVTPLVIILGAAISDTTYLTFPPKGLSLRWFENIFEVTAFRSTIVTSLELGVLATSLALILGIPTAYALRKYRVVLPGWLSTLFVLPILIPEIVFACRS